MKTTTKAYIAFLFICIVWGTTYLALRIGVLHYPPFLFAGIRQVISGIMLSAAALLLFKKADWSARNLLQQLVVGILLITLGNGLVTWAEKTIPSGVAALICSMMPIFAVLINLVTNGERLNLFIVLGMVLGFGGVILIFQNSLSELRHTTYLVGIGTLFIATFSWALGSMMNKKRANKTNPIFNSGLQLFFGGMVMLFISPLADSYDQVDWWNTEGLLALVYLIIFGSVLAFAAYMYALKELPVGFVTSYAYVNPLVAVILGYLVLNETLNGFTALAFVSIICGVYLVNMGYRKQHKAMAASQLQKEKALQAAIHEV